MLKTTLHQLVRRTSLLASLLPRASFSAAAATSPQTVVTVLKLNNLYDNEGAVKKGRRIGRGIGSSKGKTSGRGHKGQKSRSGGSISPTFEGGQTKLYKLFPKRGFNNKNHEAHMVPLNLGTLQNYIDMGRLSTDTTITLRDLMEAGMFKPNAVKHGVKLLAEGKERLRQAVDIHISRASKESIHAIESVGGSVMTVHYNKLALRQQLRPEKFDHPIKDARPPPKYQPYYTSWFRRGYLNPAVQMREFLQDKPELEEKFEELLAKNKGDI
jgi:large subunit ribosomal protein L15